MVSHSSNGFHEESVCSLWIIIAIGAVWYVGCTIAMLVMNPVPRPSPDAFVPEYQNVLTSCPLIINTFLFLTVILSSSDLNRSWWKKPKQLFNHWLSSEISLKAGGFSSKKIAIFFL